MSKLIPKPSRTLLAALISLAPLLCGCRILIVDPPPPPPPIPPPRWTLVWSDEFSAPDGSSPDPAKWTYDLGGKGWGNHEL
jgi:hypothetical protein